MSQDPRVERAKAAIHWAKFYNLRQRCDRVASWLIVAFCISVPTFLSGMAIAVNISDFYGTMIAIPAAAVGLSSGLAYLSLLFMRDVIGRLPLQFSLRSLLIATTLVAVGLGLIVWLSH